MSTNINSCKQPGPPPMEAGTYFARCCGVIELGLQLTKYDGAEKVVPQILLIFEFPSELIDQGGEKKRRWMSQTYTMSIHEKSKLRNALKSWRGKDFTEAEIKDFDIKNTLNAACTITISQTEKNGNVYANISAIGKMMKNAPPPPDVLNKYHFDMDDPETWKCFSELPEWVQTKINNSLTLKERGIQISKAGESFQVGAQHPPQGDFDELGDDDDDLPF